MTATLEFTYPGAVDLPLTPNVTRTSEIGAARSGELGGSTAPLFARRVHHAPLRSWSLTWEALSAAEVSHLVDQYYASRFGVIPVWFVPRDDEEPTLVRFASMPKVSQGSAALYQVAIEFEEKR